MFVAVLAVALAAVALAGPPPATLDGKRLAVSSWCWGAKCGAPIAASTRVVRVRRGATVRVTLAFSPTEAHLTIAGRPQAVTGRGHELDWHATRGGGISLRVTSPHGWVTYVARLSVT